MQNYCKTIGALAAASALVAGTAKAEIEYSINGGFHNEYIWRGIDFGKDMTTVGADMATEIYGLDVSAGIWHADFDAPLTAIVPGFPGQFSTTETDIYADVSKELGIWGLTGSVGYIMYVFDDTAAVNSPFNGIIDDAQEIYFGLSKDVGYGISADLTYYWDVETDNEGYIELGFSKSYELTDCVSLGLDTRLGYAYEESDFANWVTTASLDWAFTDSAVLSPYVLWAVEGENETYYSNNSEAEFVGGVNLTVSF